MSAAAPWGVNSCVTRQTFDPEPAFRNLCAHVSSIARADTVLLSYEQVYRNEYNLVVHGYGRMVYSFLNHVMSRMSLCKRKGAYYDAVLLIYKVSLHLDNRWCTHRKLPCLLDCAHAAYDRPVARHWRRALFMVFWKCRLAKWRAAFTEVWLRPGGVGEQQLATRFKNHAHAHVHVH
jgi:hypothetical protein